MWYVVSKITFPDSQVRVNVRRFRTRTDAVEFFRGECEELEAVTDIKGKYWNDTDFTHVPAFGTRTSFYVSDSDPTEYI
mgnify:FL=1